MLIKSRFLDACILGFIVLSTYNPTLGLVMNEVRKSFDVNIGKMLSNIDFSRLATIEEDELNDENDEEDNEESPT